MAVLSIPSWEAPLTPEEEDAEELAAAEAAKAENVVEVGTCEVAISCDGWPWPPNIKVGT